MYNIVYKFDNNIKNKKYHSFGTFPKFNGKIIETEAKLIPLTHIYMTPNTHIHDP